MDRASTRRFWGRVDKQGVDECWPWLGGKVSALWPYGQFWVKGKVERTHRISWRLHYGEIPNGLCVLHHCDNPPCVNPRHLFLGTRGDNNRDAFKKGRLKNNLKYGEEHQDSKLTNEEVLEIRAEYKEKKEPYRIIAKRYGVHPETVGKIIRKESWKRLLDKENASDEK